MMRRFSWVVFMVLLGCSDGCDGDPSEGDGDAGTGGTEAAGASGGGGGDSSGGVSNDTGGTGGSVPGSGGDGDAGSSGTGGDEATGGSPAAGGGTGGNGQSSGGNGQSSGGMTGTGGGPAASCDEAGVSPTVGQIVISEVMVDPVVRPATGPIGQYIEFSNVSAEPLDLCGCTFEMSGALPVVPIFEPVSVPPGGQVVFANRADQLEFDPDGVFGILSTMLPTADTVNISCPDESGTLQLIDEAEWDQNAGSFNPRAVSFSLDPENLNAEENDDPSAWCGGLSIYAIGDAGANYGTPGAPNDPCLLPGEISDCGYEGPLELTVEESANPFEEGKIPVFGWMEVPGWTDLSANLNDSHPLVGMRHVRKSVLELDGPWWYAPLESAEPWGAPYADADSFFRGIIVPVTLLPSEDFLFGTAATSDGGRTYTYCDSTGGDFSVEDLGVITAIEDEHPNDIFISEWVGGPDGNQAIELYNPTDVLIGVYGCRISVRNLLAPTIDIPFTGALFPGGTLVLCNSEIDEAQAHRCDYFFPDLALELAWDGLEGCAIPPDDPEDLEEGVVYCTQSYRSEGHLVCQNGTLSATLDTVGDGSIQVGLGAGETHVRQCGLASGGSGYPDLWNVGPLNFSGLGTHQAECE